MKLGYTIIYVDDVPKTMSFYEAAFQLKPKFLQKVGSEAYGELDTGAATLAFASTQLANSNLPEGFRENSLEAKPAGFEVGLVTEDVDAAYDHAVVHGAHSIVPPTPKPWGQRVAYVRDLNGVLVGICSPVSP